MESINREELLKMVNLSEEDLDKITGGEYAYITDCLKACFTAENPQECANNCIPKSNR